MPKARIQDEIHCSSSNQRKKMSDVDGETEVYIMRESKEEEFKVKIDGHNKCQMESQFLSAHVKEKVVWWYHLYGESQRKFPSGFRNLLGLRADG